MDVVHSSPYHPQGNGLAERSVQEVKKYLKKNGALQGPALDKMMLHLNSVESSIAGAGSNFERFYSRQPRWLCPSLNDGCDLVERSILIKRRQDTQQQAAIRRGHGNNESLKIGDKVRVRNNRDGVWKLKGNGHFE